MFLFIAIRHHCPCPASSFQYISCSYLSQKRRKSIGYTLISIHLMFLFIGITNYKGTFAQKFQYISCSYLSEVVSVNEETKKRFQYISCSYLSFLSMLGLYVGKIFQYISCSYLSEKTVAFTIPLHYFNTSHVLIYRRNINSKERNKTNFNTSHVLIYP